MRAASLDHSLRERQQDKKATAWARILLSAPRAGGLKGRGEGNLVDLPPIPWTPGYATAVLASYSAGES